MPQITTNKLKPKFPKIAPTITFTVTARLILDIDRYSSGSMLMKISDCVSTINDGEERIGEIGAAMGGSVFVTIGGREWVVDRILAWKAAHDAEAEQYLSKLKRK